MPAYIKRESLDFSFFFLQKEDIEFKIEKKISSRILCIKMQWILNLHLGRDTIRIRIDSLLITVLGVIQWATLFPL